MTHFDDFFNRLFLAAKNAKEREENKIKNANRGNTHQYHDHPLDDLNRFSMASNLAFISLCSALN
jgi:hypothetical protein